MSILLTPFVCSFIKPQVSTMDSNLKYFKQLYCQFLLHITELFIQQIKLFEETQIFCIISIVHDKSSVFTLQKITSSNNLWTLIIYQLSGRKKVFLLLCPEVNVLWLPKINFKRKSAYRSQKEHPSLFQAPAQSMQATIFHQSGTWYKFCYYLKYS